MSFNIHGSFLNEDDGDFGENATISFSKAHNEDFNTIFSMLKPGMIIPPSDFQNWLHPHFIANYTTIIPDMNQTWLKLK